MIIDQTTNFISFGLFAIIGIVFFVCYKFKDKLIEKIKNIKVKILFDIIMIVALSLCCYIASFLVALKYNYGNFRAFMLVGFVFGIYFYKITFCKLFALTKHKVYNLFKGKIKCKKQPKKHCG